MSQLWLRLLEWLGSVRIPLDFLSKSKQVRIGNPMGTDFLKNLGWKRYLNAEDLYYVWSPPIDSPWEAYHCLPLFAAVDAIPNSQIGPIEADRFRWQMPTNLESPAWATPECLYFVDLQGPESVALGAYLVAALKAQPICTFDNWPAPNALLAIEDTLAALLYFAAFVSKFRSQMKHDAPPVWICEAGRLGTRPGMPREFDNRY
ncbi:MAG: hypothetical protein EA369_00275, partial [Bradymonadales bacterium]